jgi:hypothetical protein
MLHIIQAGLIIIYRSSKGYRNFVYICRIRSIVVVVRAVITFGTWNTCSIPSQIWTDNTQMHEKLPPGITLVKAEDFQTWLVDIQVMDSNPIYQGETYRLKFNFSSQYPIQVRTDSIVFASPRIAVITQPYNVLTHAPHSHQRSHLPETSLTQYHGIRTSTPTASSASTCSTDKAGHRFTTSRAYASACKVCSRATPRKSDQRATMPLYDTIHNGHETSISCSMTIQSKFVRAGAERVVKA